MRREQVPRQRQSISQKHKFKHRWVPRLHPTIVDYFSVTDLIPTQIVKRKT